MKLNPSFIQELAKRGAEARLVEIMAEAEQLRSFLDAPAEPVHLEVIQRWKPTQSVAHDKGPRRWTPEQRKAQGARMRKLWRAGKFGKRP